MNQKPSQKKLFIVLFAAVQTIFILTFYRRGIYADQWDLLPLLQLYLSDGAWFKAALSLHGGHYHTSAYLVMLPLAELTHWSLLAETGVIIGLNLLIFGLIYMRYLRGLVVSEGRFSNYILLAFIALYFSLSHGGNALWSWQIAVYLTVLGLALVVALLAQPTVGVAAFCGAVLGALIGSYAFACGFAIWPAGFLILAFNTGLGTKKKYAYCFVWCAIAALVLARFLMQLVVHSSASVDINAVEFCLFLLYYLGTPVAYFSRELSLLVAVIGLLIFMVLATRLLLELWLGRRQKQGFVESNRIPESVGVVAMGVFALACGVLIALGRLPFGLDQARSFRYFMFAQFFWFSVLLLVWHHYQHNKNAFKGLRGLMSRVSLGLLITMLLFNAQKVGRSAASVAQSDDALFFDLITSPSLAASAIEMTIGYPNASQTMQYVEVLKRNRLSYFANQQQPDP